MTGGLTPDATGLKRLPRSFYLRPTLKVARELLGKLLVRRWRDTLLLGRIVEVEAYLGARDPASHAYRGRTPRNDVMFWKGGHLYVYFTYGMHFCANIVTGSEGVGHAVLLRAVEPLEGIEVMFQNRSPVGTKKEDLCRGPARLCQAFGITRRENGTDLCGNELWLAQGRYPSAKVKVARSERIGISNGRERRWRFFVKNSPSVSKTKPSASAGATLRGQTRTRCSQSGHAGGARESCP